MGKANKTRKFAKVKRMMKPNDPHKQKAEEEKKETKRSRLTKMEIKKIEKERVALFFSHNKELGPPYQVLLDTNFINFSIQYKLDIVKEMMNALLAKCVPVLTDCVVAEIEKMGHRYRMALKITKDTRFTRLTCTHKGTYADDCLVDRVKQHRCYIVATMDKDLRRRIRKVPGVPLMHIAGHKYKVEKMAEDLGNMY
ncbi:unnamed protein product [Moneuplotes crassus]|uniref:PIN domain-containing protein n=1 Tax=Euplotes crassus TaxID=5936 RepID=A0AAD1XZY3_EUPCR|nr:unnamed protein product [Moneuplotes crassus]